MEAHSDSILEDVRHERALIILLSIVEPDIIKESKFLHHKIEIIKNIALEKIHRQRILNENNCFRITRKTVFWSNNIIVRTHVFLINKWLIQF